MLSSGIVRRLFEGGHYYAQLWDCAAPIRGRLLNRVRHLFDEIQYFIFSSRERKWKRKGRRQEEGPKGRAEKYNKFKNL